MSFSTNYENFPPIKDNGDQRLTPKNQRLEKNTKTVPLPSISSPKTKVTRDLQTLKGRMKRQKPAASTRYSIDPRSLPPTVAKPEVVFRSDSDSELPTLDVDSKSSYTTSSTSSGPSSGSPINRLFEIVVDFFDHRPKVVELPPVKPETPQLVVATPLQPMVRRWKPGDLPSSAQIERLPQGLNTFQRQKNGLNLISND